mgnify:CR=1 FL=1
MGILVVGSVLITRRLSAERTVSRWQNLIDVQSRIAEYLRQVGNPE